RFEHRRHGRIPLQHGPREINKRTSSHLMKHSEKELIDAATRVRENSYAPFSDFRVGSALETEDGEIIAGCNVESASYGLTVCGEGGPILENISGGKRKIQTTN